ncbi:hypothetical protein C475_06175 [Halosimplex carlsbadense 2-9-1]|uniref:Uncharacterized protein n=1 Tax=Halosimplex carlsbadense 2-9-1 TaxID=797114 RepID=M0CXY0_9EURY|nr:hypothetical protein [Halosimplex carlsbadense]ELZ27483.1 hypothetical protein C475_06175 [Halosimplex carlsbadense 2-9-1]
MKALCPNCGKTESEHTDRRRGTESALTIEFSCPECDHDWTVSL